MTIAATLLPEFDHEHAKTRTLLERAPEKRAAWRPHPKSFALFELATHLANLPKWVVLTIERDDFDTAPKDGPPPRAALVESASELLATFDRNTRDARAALAGADDSRLTAPWTLLAAGKPVFSLPRIAALRAMVMNHGIHHRGQLSVYLRLLDVPLPALYGPSADEAK